uniref:C2H2-type domain-containing protein n=1 Tax=Hucho hucho TaxID=62062 RepID=A0A4W5JTI4_9TELE
MEEREDVVNIFKTQVKMVLDILLNVAVSEITHIFQGTSGNATFQNTVLPVALCSGDHAAEAVQACRLKNALEIAICAHGETTGVTPRAIQHDGGEAPSGSVAMPRRDDGEDMHINLNNERLDMDWEVVKFGVFEEGDSIGNSMQMKLEDMRLVGHCHRRLRICWDCGKIFYRKRKLRWHRRLSHTGEKPYCCSQCHRAFSLRKNLKHHQRAHTGEKPYHCKDCGKQFRCNGKLKTHMRFHTGEKPFGCTLCGKKYRVLKNLERHMATAHPHANPPLGRCLSR